MSEERKLRQLNEGLVVPKPSPLGNLYNLKKGLPVSAPPKPIIPTPKPSGQTGGKQPK